jgi:hypothetical protein
MKLLDVITSANGRISGGDPFLWDCYGDFSQYLEFRDANGLGYAHCIYDTRTYIVYEIHMEVPQQELPFRWLNDSTRTAYYKEAEARGVEPDFAWDEVGYIHLDTEELALEYLKDIGEGNYEKIEKLLPNNHNVTT